MANHYTNVSVSGYNSGAPPDDGSTGSDNTLTWAKHKTKLGDPLKTAIEQMDTNIDSAFENVPKMATGSYTGDGGVTKAITGVGFRPRRVEIAQKRTSGGGTVAHVYTTDAIVDDNASGAAILIDLSGTSTMETARIKSLDADGFTVGSAGADAHPNTNGVGYNWTAWG